MSKPPSPRFVLVVVVVVAVAEAIVGLVPNRILPVPDGNKAVHKSIIIVFAYLEDNHFAKYR